MLKKYDKLLPKYVWTKSLNVCIDEVIFGKRFSNKALIGKRKTLSIFEITFRIPFKIALINYITIL